MVGSVLGAFAGIKNVLAEADAGGGSIGTGGAGRTTPLVPAQVSRTETTEGNGKTFIVQSDLEGSALIAQQIHNQTSLGGG